MALPRIYQKLFQNEGTSTILRPDIVPACDNVSITNFNSEQSGEYTLTGDKTQAEGYPYDTSDAVYFKVINTGDEIIQYWYHDNTMLVRYKKGTDGTWSEWEQVGKDLTEELKALDTKLTAADTALDNKITDLSETHTTDITDLSGKITELTTTHTTDISDLSDKITNGDNELAAQIQQLSIADSTLLSQISSVADRVTSSENSITNLTNSNATNTSNIATNTSDIATNTSNISDIFTRLDDVSNWESTALMHNNIYRGANLLGSGHFSSIAAIMTAVRAGNFDDIYVGDYIPASITVDGTADVKNFRVAAINLLNARSDIWGTTKPNLCIVPDKLGNSYMNSTNTTEGGYVGSYMYTDVLPKYYKAIAGDSGTPFNGYLQTTTERLTNAIDTSKTCNGYSGWTGAATGVSGYANQNLTLMSEVEVYGHNHWSSTAWDGETIATQLPMFRVNPGSITLNSSSWWGWWLRGVTHSPSSCVVGSGLVASFYGASLVLGVRPRFFIA